MNVLTIDIGGTKTAAAIVAADGAISHKQIAFTPAQSGAEAVLRATIELGWRVIERARSDRLRVVGVGVGTAGHVDVDRGLISYAADSLPGWTGVRLRDELRSAFNLPVAVDNDVNAMALGELRRGAGRGTTHGLYIAVGTGVGGAIVFGGQVWRGATWTAGEIGHLVVNWDDDRVCSCGQTGHLEAYAAGPAVAARYRSLRGSDQFRDLQAVAALARQHDIDAITAIAEGARVLGVTLGGLLSAIDLPLVVIGGGVSEVGDLWWQPLLDAIRSSPMPGPARVDVRPAALGSDAVLIGAAQLAFDLANEEGSGS